MKIMNCCVFILFAVTTYQSKCLLRDFPGGTVVRNPPANAGGHGFEPWSRKIPHAAEQLSPCTTTTEPAF